MKKIIFISSLLIILINVGGCNNRFKNSVDNIPNNPNVVTSNIESPTPTNVRNLESETDSTPKTYTYEVRAHIHENLPEYRFVATGKKWEVSIPEDKWAPAFVTGLNVYDENGFDILTKDFTDVSKDIEGNPIYFQMIDTMGLHVVDVNFDGYKDILILNDFQGAHSNSWYDCWLWDSKLSSFIYCKSFAKICNPAIDWEKQCIYSSGGSGSDNHDYFIFQYMNGKFVISKELHWNSASTTDTRGDDIITTEGIYIKEEQLVNGHKVIVHDGFLAKKYADTLLLKYNNKEPWELKSPRWYMIGGHHADVWLEH